MASMRSIKRRRTSVQSTQQITKAMKLVSTVKLQRAKARAERSKSYFISMYETIKSVLERAGEINHPYLQPGESDRKAVVLITSNRGLAGGYNSNVVKLLTRGEMPKDKIDVYAIGKKGRDLLVRYGYNIVADYSDVIEEPVYADAMRICDDLLRDYKEGKIGEIYLAYTAFKNTVSHEPSLIKLLPFDASDNEPDAEDMETEADKYGNTIMNFEMEETDALDLLIPKYVTSLIHGGMIEAIASENGARMQAMDSATSNAEEMIEKLSLQYNRARQGSITQELTEIIAGAEAIG